MSYIRFDLSFIEFAYLACWTALNFSNKVAMQLIFWLFNGDTQIVVNRSSQKVKRLHVITLAIRVNCHIYNKFPSTIF